MASAVEALDMDAQQNHGCLNTKKLGDIQNFYMTWMIWGYIVGYLDISGLQQFTTLIFVQAFGDTSPSQPLFCPKQLA